MATIITTKLTKAEVRNIISLVPGIIRGRERDPHNLHNKFWGAVALSMYESLHDAFDDKSQGGQDELGHSWDDITERTKAYSRPIYPGEMPRRIRLNAKRQDTIGLLSPEEYKRWKLIFAIIYNKDKDKLGDAEAKVKAAKVAWKKLKEEGAQTKIDVLGSRNLLILRNTERLYRSFLPGKLSTHSYRKYNKDQIYIVEKGAITIGTKVEYATDVFKKRPLWIGDLSPWIAKASRAGMKRIVNYLKDILV